MKLSLKSIFFFISILAYNFSFWNEKFGINLFLFSLLMMVFLFVLNKESFSHRNVQLSTVLTLLTGSMVVYTNSSLSKWMHFISFFITTGLVFQPALRFIGYALLTVLYNYLKKPFKFIHWENEGEIKNVRYKKIKRYIRLSGIPLFFVLVFFIIYSSANPVFWNYSSTILQKIGDALEEFFKHISIWRILFVFGGMVILSGILYNYGIISFIKEEAQFRDTLHRVRKSPYLKFRYKVNISLHLKNELHRGVILLLLLNIMIAFLNYIDIKFLWFNFSMEGITSLQDMVHFGTELLILSIFLSMGIVAYFFKGNLNFYSKNTWLKRMAYLWIIQNIVLCISVFLRNYHYIAFHGLAYKRIGVYVFLFLTMLGLISMIYKIWQRKSLFFLFSLNTWAAYVVMSMMTLVNWDIFIARHNIQHKNISEIDVDFYLEMSAKALPAVYNNLDKVKAQIEAHAQPNHTRWIEHLDYNGFKKDLDNKRDKYLREHEKYTWLSWNYADRETIEQLETITKKEEEIKQSKLNDMIQNSQSEDDPEPPIPNAVEQPVKLKKSKN